MVWLLLLILLMAIFGVGAVIEGILKFILIVVLLIAAAGLFAWYKLTNRGTPG